jgi:hypothetical protein
LNRPPSRAFAGQGNGAGSRQGGGAGGRLLPRPHQVRQPLAQRTAGDRVLEREPGSPATRCEHRGTLPEPTGLLELDALVHDQDAQTVERPRDAVRREGLARLTGAGRGALVVRVHGRCRRCTR